MKRRKTWRNFRKHHMTNRHIRFLCLLLLIMEFIMFSYNRLIPIPTIEIREKNELVIYQLPAEANDLSDNLTNQKSDNKIYGIRIHLKEGTIEFYRQENYESPYTQAEEDSIIE